VFHNLEIRLNGFDNALKVMKNFQIHRNILNRFSYLPR